MEELCQPTLNGRGGPIAPIAIQATNFGLKNDMIQQVQKFSLIRGPGDEANKHLDTFSPMSTQVLKVKRVSDDALRLYPSLTPCSHRIVPPNGSRSFPRYSVSPPLTQMGQEYFSENTSTLYGAN
ncbi:hypothetical protein Tco_0885005 [Tanacetum coccineum]